MLMSCCVQPKVFDGTNSARAVLQPGVRGALQAKYWEAASPGPISAVSSVRFVIIMCAAGVCCGTIFDYGCSCVTPGS